MYQKIQGYLSRFASLSAEELTLFENTIEFKKVPKKTILLRAGDICNFEAYVNKGCIREYIIDENGVEVTLQFAVEDWWVSDLASFQDQTPCTMYIETLEDC